MSELDFTGIETAAQDARPDYSAVAFAMMAVVKHRARTVVNMAMARGAIKKPLWCERCHRSGQVEAHHWNYGQPFVIEWLCRDCHKAETRRIRSVALKALPRRIGGGFTPREEVRAAARAPELVRREWENG